MHLSQRRYMESGEARCGLIRKGALSPLDQELRTTQNTLESESLKRSLSWVVFVFNLAVHIGVILLHNQPQEQRPPWVSLGPGRNHQVSLLLINNADKLV